MKITKEGTAAHRELSEISAKFLEFVEENPEVADRSQYRSLNWHDKRIKLQPWPTFINQDTKEQLAAASLKIAGLIKTLPQRLFSNNPQQISRYYETTLDIVDIQLDSTHDEHISQLLARSDFVMSPTGLKCLEFNISSDLGGLENPIYANMYLNVPILARFLNRYKVKIKNSNLLLFLLQYLTGIAVNKWPLYKEFNIAFVIPGLAAGMDRRTEDVYLNRLYRGVLDSFEKNMPGQIHLCDYQHLNVTTNGVFYNDKEIHTLIELYGGNVLPEILRHFNAGKILVFNGPISRLLSNKLNLALLSENEAGAGFSKEEQETIKKYIPWTRKITPGDTTYKGLKVKLENFIRSHKDQLVIKPSEGYGGIDVSLGKNKSPDQWDKIISGAISHKNWVVQEYVPSLPYWYQWGDKGCCAYDAIWGTFVLGTQYGGEWVRILPKKDSDGVINTRLGAEVSVVFEVDE